MLITNKRVIVVRYTDRYLERAAQKTMTVICALKEYAFFFLKSRMVGSIASFSLRFPLFPLTPNLFHFKYVKVKNCTEIITMFFSRSSYTRALKFRYKLNIKRTNANKAIWLTSFDAKGGVRMTLQSERCKSNLHCLPILYSGDKNLSLM